MQETLTIVAREGKNLLLRVKVNSLSIQSLGSNERKVSFYEHGASLFKLFDRFDDLKLVEIIGNYFPRIGTLLAVDRVMKHRAQNKEIEDKIKASTKFTVLSQGRK